MPHKRSMLTAHQSVPFSAVRSFLPLPNGWSHPTWCSAYGRKTQRNCGRQCATKAAYRLWPLCAFLCVMRATARQISPRYINDADGDSIPKFATRLPSRRKGRLKNQKFRKHEARAEFLAFWKLFKQPRIPFSKTAFQNLKSQKAQWSPAFLHPKSSFTAFGTLPSRQNLFQKCKRLPAFEKHI